MTRPSFPKSIFEFQERFDTEEKCAAFLIESRWPDGFQCPRCGSTTFYWIADRKLMQCATCRYQVSPTAGTVMHRSKQPLRAWFYAAYLVTTHTPGISAVQLQRQIGVTYETAFMMLHKLRAAMVKADREKLRGVVEVDESYVGGREESGGRRHIGNKALVVGAVEVRGTKAGRVRLKVIQDASQASIEKFVTENIEPGTEIRTDAWSGYFGLRGLGYQHVASVQGGGRNAPKILPHIHRVFSNLKTWLMGTHHGAVRKQHLQAYLNEFVFRFNRRQTPMAAFQTVLGLSQERAGPTYKGLYGIAKGAEEYAHPRNPR